MVLDLYNNDTDQFLHVPTANILTLPCSKKVHYLLLLSCQSDRQLSNLSVSLQCYYLTSHSWSYYYTESVVENQAKIYFYAKFVNIITYSKTFWIFLASAGNIC